MRELYHSYVYSSCVLTEKCGQKSSSTSRQDSFRGRCQTLL
jgi:hypothetical protein